MDCDTATLAKENFRVVEDAFGRATKSSQRHFDFPKAKESKGELESRRIEFDSKDIPFPCERLEGKEAQRAIARITESAISLG